MATIQDVFSHIYTTEAHLGDVPIKNGQIILCADSEKLYIDHGTTRVSTSDVVQVENQEALPLAPLDKLYITKDTGDIFFYINGAWKNLTTVISNYTAFEVYATDTEIAAGSVDDVTGLTYTEAVPAGMTHHFALRTDVAAAKAAEADVVVDWGDGVRETFVDAYGVDTQDWESDREVIYRMRHTYAAPGRYIVTISGKDYWNFCSPNDDFVSGEYILSRVFDVDLPVASCVTNLTMACRWAQKLLRVRIPTGLDLFANRHNAAFLFKGCRNLVEAIGMKTKFRYARDVSCMFEDCDNLTTTDFELPVEVLKSTGYQHVFFGCHKLAVDINTLLPKTGFANRKVDLSSTFYNCAALTGTVPADILWKDSSKLWSAEAAFDGCSDAIRAQVPTSWGGTSTDEIISDLPVAKLSLNGTLPNTANGLVMLNTSGKVDSSLLPEQAATNIDNYTSNSTIRLTSTAGAVNLIANTTEAAMYSGTAHVKANVDSVELQGTNLKFNSNAQNTAGGLLVIEEGNKLPALDGSKLTNLPVKIDEARLLPDPANYTPQNNGWKVGLEILGVENREDFLCLYPLNEIVSGLPVDLTNKTTAVDQGQALELVDDAGAFEGKAVRRAATRYSSVSNKLVIPMPEITGPFTVDIRFKAGSSSVGVGGSGTNYAISGTAVSTPAGNLAYHCGNVSPFHAVSFHALGWSNDDHKLYWPADDIAEQGWYWIRFTRSATAVHVFMNGKLLNSTTNSGAMRTIPAGNWTILPDSDDSNVLLDEVRITNTCESIADYQVPEKSAGGIQRAYKLYKDESGISDLSDYNSATDQKVSIKFNSSDSGETAQLVMKDSGAELRSGIRTDIVGGSSALSMTDSFGIMLTGGSIALQATEKITLNAQDGVYLGESAPNTANGLLVIGADGKIPTNLYDSTIDLSDYQTNGPIKLTTTSNAGDGSGDIIITTSENIILKGGVYDKIEIGNATMHITSEAAVLINGQSGFVFQSNGTDVISESSGHLTLADGDININGTLHYNGASVNAANGLVQLDGTGKILASQLPEMTQSWTKVTINQSSFATSDDTYGGSYYELNGICSVEVYDANGYKVEFDVKCDFTNSKTRIYIPSGLTADTISNWTLLYLAKSIA